jgi:hypothetical protein
MKEKQTEENQLQTPEQKRAAYEVAKEMVAKLGRDTDVQVALDPESQEMAKLRHAPVEDVRWRIKAGLTPKQAIEAAAAQKENDDALTAGSGSGTATQK